jgi:hypothetical protein
MDTLHSIIKQIIAAKGSPQFRADADTKENCLSKPAINNEEQHKRNVIFPIIVGFLLFMQWIFARLDTFRDSMFASRLTFGMIKSRYQHEGRSLLKSIGQTVW